MPPVTVLEILDSPNVINLRNSLRREIIVKRRGTPCVFRKMEVTFAARFRPLRKRIDASMKKALVAYEDGCDLPQAGEIIRIIPRQRKQVGYAA